ncbi:MAG TPA: DUF4214 domain-containing protein [Burkholderiaceae bacterium]
MKRLILVAGLSALLAGCGGGSGDTATSPAPVQQRQKVQTVPHLTATDIKAKRMSMAPRRNAKQQPADYEGVVQSLYIAYFGRPADPNGLANFEADLLADGAPTDVQGLLDVYATDANVQSLIDAFGTSAESQRLYGNGDASAFVTQVFANLLDRQPQSTGLDFWATQIALGNVTQGAAALNIMAGALANTSAQGLLDAQLINNRIAASEYFTAELTNLSDTYAYAGSNAAATARNALATVNAATDATTYETTLNGAIDTLVADMPPSGTTSDYVSTDGFFTWTGSENGTIVFDYQSAQFAVDVDSGVVVDLASNQQLNGLVVDASAQLVSNGTVIGDLILVPAADGGQVAQFTYTLNGQQGIALISVANGAYTVTCGNCGG